MHNRERCILIVARNLPTVRVSDFHPCEYYGIVVCTRLNGSKTTKRYFLYLLMVLTKEVKIDFNLLVLTFETDIFHLVCKQSRLIWLFYIGALKIQEHFNHVYCIFCRQPHP